MQFRRFFICTSTYRFWALQALVFRIFFHISKCLNYFISKFFQYAPMHMAWEVCKLQVFGFFFTFPSYQAKSFPNYSIWVGTWLLSVASLSLGFFFSFFKASLGYVIYMHFHMHRRIWISSFLNFCFLVFTFTYLTLQASRQVFELEFSSYFEAYTYASTSFFHYFQPST